MLSVVADYRCRVFDFELHLNLFLSKSLNPIYMKLKIVISILLLALSLNFTYAQKFFHGEITLINKKKLEGFVNPPSRPGDKTIKFKTGETAPARSIKSDSIRMVKLISEDGNTGTLVNLEYRKNQNAFLIQVIEGYASLYLTGDLINIDKQGNIVPVATFVSGRETPSFEYYIQRKTEKYPTIIAIVGSTIGLGGQGSFFRKAATNYFKDWPELITRLEKKEFSQKDVEKVVNLYNEHMAGK